MHIWLIELTLAVVQALETQKDVTVDSVIRTVDSHIVGEWKQRGVCPWQAGDQSSDLSWQTFEIGQDGSNRWRSRQTQGCIWNQIRKWHTYSTELSVCGARIVDLLRRSASHLQRTELHGSRMSRLTKKVTWARYGDENKSQMESAIKIWKKMFHVNAGKKTYKCAT